MCKCRACYLGERLRQGYLRKLVNLIERIFVNLLHRFRHHILAASALRILQKRFYVLIEKHAVYRRKGLIILMNLKRFHSVADVERHRTAAADVGQRCRNNKFLELFGVRESLAQEFYRAFRNGVRTRLSVGTLHQGSHILVEEHTLCRLKVLVFGLCNNFCKIVAEQESVFLNSCNAIGHRYLAQLLALAKHINREGIILCAIFQIVIDVIIIVATCHNVRPRKVEHLQFSVGLSARNGASTHRTNKENVRTV